MNENQSDWATSLAASHTPAAIRRRLADGPRHSYLRDFIYGAIDGTVTTFAIVSGVAGAGLSSGVVIVLGLANLIGDGFSMAVSNDQGTRVEEQLRRRARQTEEMHIRHHPAGEREEIRQILQRKGFEGDDLERAVDVITSDVSRWGDMMLQEELGMRRYHGGGISRHRRGQSAIRRRPLVRGRMKNPSSPLKRSQIRLVWLTVMRRSRRVPNQPQQHEKMPGRDANGPLART